MTTFPETSSRPQPVVHRHDDAESLVAETASRLLARLEEAQHPTRATHVSLTGGTVADLLHRELARRAAESSVDWSRLVFWWGDERFVPAASDERNAGQARAALLDGLDLAPSQVREVLASDRAADAEAAAADYAHALEAADREFELVILGVGPDGHVASLFPHHPALAVDDRLAVAVHDSPKPPPDRVSLTFPALNRARAVWFVVSGEGKAEAVARALAEDGSVESTPARGVRGRQETLWLLDAAAASALPS